MQSTINEHGLEFFEKEIEGRAYICTPFLSRKGLRVFVRLSKLLSPSIAALSSTGDDAEKLKNAVSSLFERIDDRGVENLIMDLISQIQFVDGNKKPYVKDVFDMHFQGRLSDLFQVAYFAIEANYSDFFSKFKNSTAIQSAIVAATTSKFPTP